MPIEVPIEIYIERPSKNQEVKEKKQEIYEKGEQKDGEK